jgi:hypothetical protein
VAVATVAVVAVAVGGVLLFTKGGGGADKAPPGPSARPAGSLFATESGAKSDGRDQELNGIAASGSTVVAIGGEFGTLNYRAEFLVSTDGGRSFRLADVRTPDGREPPYGDAPRVIAGGPDGWVALGGSAGVNAVWTSGDGQSWVRQPQSSGSAFGRNDRVSKVIATGSGFVAVGDTSARGDFTDALPVVWVSADGRRWTRSSADQLRMTLGEGPLSLTDAAAVGNTIVAYGWRPKGGKIIADGVWRSADDGRTWAPVSVPRPKDAAPTGISIAASPAGFLAVRGAARLKGDKVVFYGVVMSSANGQSWSQLGEIDLPGFQAVQRLDGSDRGLAAVVKTKNGLVLARSTDGRSWQSAGTVPMPAGRIFQGVATTAGATLVAARDGGGADANAVLIERDAQGNAVPVDLSRIPGAVLPDQAVSGVAAGNGRVVAVGSTNGDGAIWTSNDGDHWTRAAGADKAFVRPQRQRLVGVAAGTKGWLAVGYDGPPPSRPLVVTSVNGSTWRVVSDDGPFRPGKGTALLPFGVAAGPSGFVIVGEDGPSAAVWRTTDLQSWTRGDGDLAGKPTARRWMRGAVGGAFGYVAVGGLDDPSAPDAQRERPVVWSSPDGGKWSAHELPLPQGTARAWLDKVVAKGDVLVAAGTAGTASGQRAFAFRSADGGKTWQETALPDAAGQSSGAALVNAATATPGGFVISGAAGRPGETDVVLWTSRDGRSWTLDRPTGTGLSAPGDQWIAGLTALGGDLLAVGFTASHQGEQPILWRRPIP